LQDCGSNRHDIWNDGPLRDTLRLLKLKGASVVITPEGLARFTLPRGRVASEDLTMRFSCPTCLDSCLKLVKEVFGEVN
jgi:hypothetical protein